MSRGARPLLNSILGASVAFGVGVLVTWLALRDDVSEPRQIIDAASAPATDANTILTPAGTLAAANQAYDRRDWPRAIELYQRSIAQGIDNADVRTDLGNGYRFSGQPRDALAQYEIAQKQDPRHEISFFNSATLQIEGFQDPARAVALLRDYLSRFPDSPNAANARSILEQVKKETDPTEGVADWLREQKPPAAP